MRFFFAPSCPILRSVSLCFVFCTAILMVGCNRTPTTVAKKGSVSETGTPVSSTKPDAPQLPSLTSQQKAVIQAAQGRAIAWGVEQTREDSSIPFNPNGVVICEPKGQDSLKPFGAGCSRWLHLTVGGQGSLSCTPLWGDVDEAWREMQHYDGGLSPEEAVTLARKLGVTHVATAQIKGTATNCVLTYQLWKMPERKAVGPALKAQGTRAQVALQLPRMAREICQGLNVVSPKIPVMSASADELSEAGTLPWNGIPIAEFGASSSVQQSDVTSARLRKLSPRLPVAGVLLLQMGTENASSRQGPELVKNLLAQAPDNAMILGQTPGGPLVF